MSDAVSIPVDRDALARETWGLLGALYFSRRPLWLAASNAAGLTPPAAFALMRLSAEEPPPLSELAGALQCDASYMTAIADRLEERGLAERRVSPRDRRVKELVLTPAGREAQTRLRSAFFDPPEGLLDLPDEDLAALRRIAGALAERAGPELLRAMALVGGIPGGVLPDPE